MVHKILKKEAVGQDRIKRVEEGKFSLLALRKGSAMVKLDRDAPVQLQMKDAVHLPGGLRQFTGKGKPRLGLPHQAGESARVLQALRVPGRRAAPGRGWT